MHMFISGPIWACTISLLLLVSVSRAGPIPQGGNVDHTELFVRALGDDSWQVNELSSRRSAAANQRSVSPSLDKRRGAPFLGKRSPTKSIVGAKNTNKSSNSKGASEFPKHPEPDGKKNIAIPTQSSGPTVPKANRSHVSTSNGKRKLEPQRNVAASGSALSKVNAGPVLPGAGNVNADKTSAEHRTNSKPLSLPYTSKLRNIGPVTSRDDAVKPIRISSKPSRSYADALKDGLPAYKKELSGPAIPISSNTKSGEGKSNVAKPNRSATTKSDHNIRPSNSAIQPGKSYADAVKSRISSDKKKDTVASGVPSHCKSGGKSKRGLYADCEEYDPHKVKALTSQDATPDVKKENPTKWWGSGKNTYTDDEQTQTGQLVTGRAGDRKVNMDTVKRIMFPQIEAQKNYYNSQGSKPYSRPPGALGVAIDPDAEGFGKHGLRMSTSMTVRKNIQVPAPPSILHPSVDALREGHGQPRRGTANSGAHVEEVNGSQRAHDGAAPFKGVFHATYEVHGNNDGRDPPPRAACEPNCKPLLQAGQGIDLHKGFRPTDNQEANREKKRNRQEAKKTAESAASGPSGRSTNTGVSTSGGKRKNDDTKDTASSTDKKPKTDIPTDYARWSDRSKPAQNYAPQQPPSDESESTLSSESSPSEYAARRRKRSDMELVRRWLEEVVLEYDI